MTLEASFAELSETFGHLERALDNLVWAVVQGQPETGEGHALVDQYDAATNDLLGLVREAQEAGKEGRQAVRAPLDLARTRQALAACHDRFNQLSVHFYDDLVSFDWIDALNNLARERGREWDGWVQGVKDALNRCPQPLHDVSEALFACWQDLTESASLLPVTVRAVPTDSQTDHAQKNASGEPQHGTNTQD
jgi:hypothetical protein